MTILTIPQAAARLGKNRATIRRHATATGEVLPGVRVFKIGRTDYVSADQVDEFLRTGQVAPREDEVEAEVAS